MTTPWGKQFSSLLHIWQNCDSNKLTPTASPVSEWKNQVLSFHDQWVAYSPSDIFCLGSLGGHKDVRVLGTGISCRFWALQLDGKLAKTGASSHVSTIKKCCGLWTLDKCGQQQQVEAKWDLIQEQEMCLVLFCPVLFHEHEQGTLFCFV